LTSSRAYFGSTRSIQRVELKYTMTGKARRPVGCAACALELSDHLQTNDCFKKDEKIDHGRDLNVIHRMRYKGIG
jgi:hypothetical protein